MIRFQFNQLKGTITQALIVVKSVEIDDFWTVDMSISTLDMSLSTLDNYPDSYIYIYIYITNVYIKSSNVHC